MPIKIRCQCGKTLNAPDAAAGKAVKCPGCGKSLRVPAAGPTKRAKPAATKSNPAKPAAAAPKAVPAATGIDDIDSLFDEEGFSAQVEAVCPNCRVEMAANAVLCTKCGYHKETGSVLEGHKTVGVDIDRSTIALEKAAEDMVKDRALQAELLKGGGMPWWMLIMVLVIGGGVLGVAVMGVNAANQETEVEGPGVLASLFMLTGATFLFASLVSLGIVIVHAFQRKKPVKVFVIGLLLGIAGGASYYYGSNMPDAGAEEEDTGLRTVL